MSPTSKAVLGVKPEYFIGKNAFDFVYEEDRERVINQFAALATEKRIEVSPFRFKSNKILRWIETVATDMTDEPSVNGIVTNSRDVTHRIENELKLKENIERFDLFLKATSDTIWDWDLLTNKVIRNKGQNSVFYNKRGVPSEGWWNDLIHPDDKDRVRKKLQLCIKRKEKKWSDEYRFQATDGTYNFILDRGYLIYNEKDVLIRMLGAMQDVTERENHIKEIEEQNIILREIAWMQSHVVRAPLCRIMGLAELLRLPDTDELTKEDIFNYIIESIQELDQITKDIIKKASEIQ